jgi:hypothetical protein
MITASEKELAVQAWRDAARELGIEVVAPFTLRVESRLHVCIAWVPQFGGKQGTLVLGTTPPGFTTDQLLIADAEKAGYRWSAVNITIYQRYNRELFMEALKDWGFAGNESKRPTWMR